MLVSIENKNAPGSVNSGIQKYKKVDMTIRDYKRLKTY